MHDALAGIPYEHIIILANTDTYGGGGIYNSYTLTTAHHKLFGPVVVHEFGHSFGGLTDEYAYDDQFVEYYYPDIEPWEQNITTKANFESKWEGSLRPGSRGPCRRRRLPDERRLAPVRGLPDEDQHRRSFLSGLPKSHRTHHPLLHGGVTYRSFFSR